MAYFQVTWSRFKDWWVWQWGHRPCLISPLLSFNFTLISFDFTVFLTQICAVEPHFPSCAKPITCSEQASSWKWACVTTHSTERLCWAHLTLYSWNCNKSAFLGNFKVPTHLGSQQEKAHQILHLQEAALALSWLKSLILQFHHQKAPDQDFSELFEAKGWQPEVFSIILCDSGVTTGSQEQISLKVMSH